MKIWILGSGSRGNAVLVECGESRLVIDAGFGVRELGARLKHIGVEPRSVESCLLTHEHTDHVKGARSAMKRWGWTLYASHGTATASRLRGSTVQRFSPGETLPFTAMTVDTTPTPHDARESVGFVITGRASGVRAAFFYDIGHASAAIARACRDIDMLVLESNHDEEMLRNGPYPRWLQTRIASDTGHLSNRSAAALARAIASRRLRYLVLAHLSEQNNLPSLALKSMRTALTKTAFRGTVTAAKQDLVVGPFAVGSAPAKQYELSL